MFAKILYSTDFSPYSDAVADCIIRLKPAGARDIIILNVVDKRFFVQYPEISLDLIETIEASAKKNIEKLKNKFLEAGFNVVTLVETGVPFSQIVAVAKTHSVSMIIMGSHGKSLIEEMLLGSTTENVMRHTTVPLLIERFYVKRTGEKVSCVNKTENQFEKILFPTDFSKHSLAVMPYLKQLKGCGTKKVVIAHIQDMTVIAPHLLDKLPEFEDIDTERLLNLKHQLLEAGISDVKTVLRDGVPYIEIEKIASEEDVGLIAMGSHGKSMVKEALIGSVSGKVIRRTKRPILVIRRR